MKFKEPKILEASMGQQDTNNLPAPDSEGIRIQIGKLGTMATFE